MKLLKKLLCLIMGHKEPFPCRGCVRFDYSLEKCMGVTCCHRCLRCGVRL